MGDWRPPPLRVRVAWDAERESRVARRLFLRRAPAPRPVEKLGLMLSAAVAGLFVGLYVRSGGERLPSVAPVRVSASKGTPAPAPALPSRLALALAPAPRIEALPEEPRTVAFYDGSKATLTDARTDLRVRVADSGLIVSALMGGKARFDVARRPSRTFRVEAGGTIVEALGTAFWVERRGPKTLVEVEHGRVRVSWASGQRELGDGEGGTFPPEPVAAPARVAAAAVAPAPARTISPQVEPPPFAAAPETASEATPAARPESPPPPEPARAVPEKAAIAPDDPEALLMQADAARLALRPAAAVEPLERLLREYAADARAPLAAFTLGRLLLDELGHPRRAAAAFARARALGPRGALAEDALRLEIESWSRAGEGERARALAAERRPPPR